MIKCQILESVAANLTARPDEPSAAAWLDRLDRRDVSARELAERCLARIDAVQPRLNAVVGCDPGAVLKAAEAADRARAGGDRRPLLGLPVSIKDSIEAAGMRCTGGSLARADFVPAGDATVVKRLRAAGAIVLAKTNVPEYSSSYETDNIVHGRTNHPLDQTRTPGGSSGGEAALVASGASPLGIGTDGGGSLRVPAHYCGITALRPTVGRVPDTGTWPATRASGYMDLFCVGPLARRADDLALVLPIIAGPDGTDPYAVPAPLGDPHAVSIDKLRVGWFLDDPRLEVTAPTRSAVHAAAAALRGAGALVSEAEAPWDDDPTELFFRCATADGGARLARDVGGADVRHLPELQAVMTLGAPPGGGTVAEWFEVVARVYRLRAAMRRVAASFDVLLCPVAAGPAPVHGGSPGDVAGADAYRAFDYVHLVALAGLPAASVPAGIESGLPIGVQVVANPYREQIALAVAIALETAL